MKIASIYLENVGIIEQLQIPVSSVVMVTGENGTGKSTIINAISAVFDGGHRPDLIGPVADKALISIVLDDGVTVRRIITRKSSEYKITTADGSIVKSPAAYVQGLVSGLSLNPTALENAKPADRVRFLQEAMPLTFTRADLVKAGCGLCDGCKQDLSLDKSGRWHGSTSCTATDLPATLDLQKFLAYREGKYDRRRSANVELKELQATRMNFAKALPEGDILRIGKVGSGDSTAVDHGKIVRAEVAEAEKVLEAARKSLADTLDGLKRDYSTEKAGISTDESREIEAARVEFEDKCQAIRAAKVIVRAKLDEIYADAVTEQRKPLDESIEAATAALATARERLEAEARMEGVRASLAQLDAKITAKDDEALTLDEQVKALDELKLDKLNAMPIPGVEIIGGEIIYDGLNFETQCNKAKRRLLAFQISALTMGELPFFIFDDAEALDEENQAELIEGLKSADFQVVMARVVTGQPLTVAAV